MDTKTTIRTSTVDGKQTVALSELDEMMLAADSPAQLAEKVLDFVLRFIPYDLSVLLALDMDLECADVLALSVNGRLRQPENADGLALDECNVPAELRHGEVFLFEASGTEGALPFGPLALRLENMCTHLSVPLLHGHELIGSLNIGSGSIRAFSRQQLALCRCIANKMASPLHRARRLAQLQHHTMDLERRLAESAAELREANSEMDAFAYSISHDLRAHLRSVMSNIQTIKTEEKNTLADKTVKHLSHVVMAAERMDRMIQDLLDYSRFSRDQAPLHPTHLGLAVAEAIRIQEPAIVHSGAEIEVQSQLPRNALGRPDDLTKVLSNLISNAVKFVRPGTRPAVKIWSEEFDGRVRLWLEDNGIGIAPDQQKRIFGLFERLHPGNEYPGAGVGLAIVRKAMMRMGGQVGVESFPARGSRFWVELRKVNGT